MQADLHPANPRGRLRGPPQKTPSAPAGRGRDAVSLQNRPFRGQGTGSPAAQGRALGRVRLDLSERGAESEATRGLAPRAPETLGGPYAVLVVPSLRPAGPRPHPGLHQLSRPQRALRFSPFSLYGVASLCPGGGVSVVRATAPGHSPSGTRGTRSPVSGAAGSSVRVLRTRDAAPGRFRSGCSSLVGFPALGTRV